MTPEFTVTFAKEAMMIDEKTLKSKLLRRELERANQMLQELIWTRYRKLASLIGKSQKVPSALLTDEEEALCKSFVSFSESYKNFADKILRGQYSNEVLAAPAKKLHKKVVLRFIKCVPKVIGVDMNTYGPFMVEDVASVPVENAKILVKQGLAEKVET